MDSKSFVRLRKKLGKTQEQIAQLLGVSVKAVRSYEQGWRNVPAHVERQLYFLVSRMRNVTVPMENCWVLKNCPQERRDLCPAWEFDCGNLCWFISGTLCSGKALGSWREKMKVCKQCELLKPFLDSASDE